MAKISRRSIHVDAKDLKKSILNANKALERKNDRLSNNIKDKEKSLKNKWSSTTKSEFGSNKSIGCNTLNKV